jgi:hypothetical protein
MVGRLAHKAQQIGRQLPPNGWELSRSAALATDHSRADSSAGKTSGLTVRQPSRLQRVVGQRGLPILWAW